MRSRELANNTGNRGPVFKISPYVGNWARSKYKCKKTKFIKNGLGDVVAHLKPQKFTVSSDL